MMFHAEMSAYMRIHEAGDAGDEKLKKINAVKVKIILLEVIVFFYSTGLLIKIKSNAF